MSDKTILLLGGTGRTGSRVLSQLLSRGLHVRAIVRSAVKLSDENRLHPNLDLVEADLLSLSDQVLKDALQNCSAAISCLGHVLSFKGVFGPPYDLVTRATMKICRALGELQPEEPVKFILMSSVSVHRDKTHDSHRGTTERAFISLLCRVLPPAMDNRRAADFLQTKIGTENRFVHWTAIRPDTLMEGEITEYSVHPELINTLFKPGKTNMANVAHFMCELATDDTTWQNWKFKLPVIVNTEHKGESD
jgi:hypothetical protein